MKLRLLTASAVLVSGAVHLWLCFDVFRHETVVGPMFLLNVAASVVIAGLLLRWRHWLPALLAAGSELLAILGGAAVLVREHAHGSVGELEHRFALRRPHLH